jgi:hypothetical protein
MPDKLIKAPSIAAGWDGYRKMVIHPQAPEIQLSECRMAFYAGATVLMEAIMKCLDPGEEPTADDMARMASIQKELDDFAATFDEKVYKAHGGKQ